MEIARKLLFPTLLSSDKDDILISAFKIIGTHGHHAKSRMGTETVSEVVAFWMYFLFTPLFRATELAGSSQPSSLYVLQPLKLEKWQGQWLSPHI